MAPMRRVFLSKFKNVRLRWDCRTLLMTWGWMHAGSFRLLLRHCSRINGCRARVARWRLRSLFPGTRRPNVLIAGRNPSSRVSQGVVVVLVPHCRTTLESFPRSVYRSFPARTKMQPSTRGRDGSACLQAHGAVANCCIFASGVLHTEVHKISLTRGPLLATNLVTAPEPPTNTALTTLTF